MGSPNFYTHTQSINVAVIPDEYDYGDLQSIEEDVLSYDDDLDQHGLLFYETVVKAGYEEGYQIYIYNFDRYEGEESPCDFAIKSLEKYGEAFDIRDYEITPERLSHLLPDEDLDKLEQLTPDLIRKAAAAEFEKLTLAIYDYAKDMGGLLIVGKSWTQSTIPLPERNEIMVDYIETEK